MIAYGPGVESALTVVVLAAGPGADLAAPIPAGATIVAADGGAEYALRRGLHVDLAVGDFDSIPAESLAALRRAGTPLEHHPAEKDATDLELALTAALAFRPKRLLVIGSATGRLDHGLGQLLLLAADRYAGVEVDARLGDASVHVIRGERTLEGATGELISLFALGGPAEGVVTEGLLYPLGAETLEPSSSRGVSNVFAADTVHVTLERGVLLAVRPGRGQADPHLAGR